MSIASDILSLSGSTPTIDLSGYLDNTDTQDLSLSGNTLSLVDGGSVSLAAYLDNTDTQNLSNVLTQGTDAGASKITNLGTPTANQDAATKLYVDNTITAQDLDISDGTTASTVDLDSQTFTIAGTSNEVETSVSGQTLTVGLPDDVVVTGYTNLGSAAPKIKQKKLTGTTSINAGETVTITHGLTMSKILNYVVLVTSTDGRLVKENANTTSSPLYFYSTFVDSNNISVTLGGSALYVKGSSFTVLITYEE